MKSNVKLWMKENTTQNYWYYFLPYTFKKRIKRIMIGLIPIQLYSLLACHNCRVLLAQSIFSVIHTIETKNIRGNGPGQIIPTTHEKKKERQAIKKKNKIKSKKKKNQSRELKAKLYQIPCTRYCDLIQDTTLTWKKESKNILRIIVKLTRSENKNKRNTRL